MARQQFVSTREFGQEFGIEADTVKTYIHKGYVRGEKFGHVWMIPRSEIARRKKNQAKRQKDR